MSKAKEALFESECDEIIVPDSPNAMEPQNTNDVNSHVDFYLKRLRNIRSFFQRECARQSFEGTVQEEILRAENKILNHEIERLIAHLSSIADIHHNQLNAADSHYKNLHEKYEKLKKFINDLSAKFVPVIENLPRLIREECEIGSGDENNLYSLTEKINEEETSYDKFQSTALHNQLDSATFLGLADNDANTVDNNPEVMETESNDCPTLNDANIQQNDFERINKRNNSKDKPTGSKRQRSSPYELTNFRDISTKSIRKKCSSRHHKIGAHKGRCNRMITNLITDPKIMKLVKVVKKTVVQNEPISSCKVVKTSRIRSNATVLPVKRDNPQKEKRRRRYVLNPKYVKEYKLKI